jgi:hypothetical protein
MKKCSYCGRDNTDEAANCHECGTEFERPAEPPPPEPAPEPARPEYEFAALSAAGQQQDWVTLVTCGTLVAADLVVMRLRAAGIETFLPDERLMQVIGWNLNTYGYVRVQVSPKDYDEARALLAAPKVEDES